MRLSARQSELMGHLSKGLKSKQIGHLMGVTEGTVKMMLHLLYTRTGAANRTALVMQHTMESIAPTKEKAEHECAECRPVHDRGQECAEQTGRDPQDGDRRLC